MLIGPCPEDYRSYIDPILQRLRYPAQVILTGRIPSEEVSWAYANAYAAVQPSIAEGFGLPIIEAMSFGLAVACSNTTSLPETAGGAARLFDPFDPLKISEAINELSQNAALKEKLSALGLQRSRVFTWRQSAEKVASEIERQLTAGKQSTGA